MARAWWPMHTSTHHSQCPAPPHLRSRTYASEYPSNMHAALWGSRVVRAHAGGAFLQHRNRMAHTLHQRAIAGRRVASNSVLLRYRVYSSCVHAGRGDGGIGAASRGGIRSPLIRPPCGPRPKNVPLQQRPSGAGVSLSTRPSVEVEMKV
jgi:hypothetical protein